MMDDKIGLELSALTSVDNQLLPEPMLEQDDSREKDGPAAGSVQLAEDSDETPNHHTLNETCCVQQQLQYLAR